MLFTLITLVNTVAEGPCDITGRAGNPCVAAHSTYVNNCRLSPPVSALISWVSYASHTETLPISVCTITLPYLCHSINYPL